MKVLKLKNVFCLIPMRNQLIYELQGSKCFFLTVSHLRILWTYFTKPRSYPQARKKLQNVKK